MYSDRRGRGGGGGRDGFGRGERDGYGGGGRDGFGGGYRREGGYGGGGDQYGQRWDRNSGDGYSKEMEVDQRHVGRIIGKGGSKIRDLQDSSGANIKVNSREVENGRVRITLTGSEQSCSHAEELITEITDYFSTRDNDGYGGEQHRGGRGRGGGGWRRDNERSYEGSW